MIEIINIQTGINITNNKMGNKPQCSKYDENGDRWILKFLVRIGVLVSGPMNEIKTEMARVMNNPVLRKEISRETFAEYRKQCKQVRSCKLIIPNDWQDYTEEFRSRVAHISLAISANWFNVALYYCYHNFNERETYERCKIERQTFRAAKIVNGLLNLARPPQTDVAPIDVHLVCRPTLKRTRAVARFLDGLVDEARRAAAQPSSRPAS